MSLDPPVKAESDSGRIDEIETNWSLIELACRNTSQVSMPARSAVVLRYLPAIQTYIRAVCRQADFVDDLVQDVCVRIMRGDFAGADPARGRFRSFLKTAVRNQVRNYVQREQIRWTRELNEIDTVTASDERAWVQAWREAVLEMVWRAMESSDAGNNSVGVRVLRLRVTYPDESLSVLHAKLTRHSEQQQTEDSAELNSLRAALYRARKRFCVLLFEEIARTLSNPTPAAVEEEAAALNLLEYLPDSLFQPR